MTFNFHYVTDYIEDRTAQPPYALTFEEVLEQVTALFEETPKFLTLMQRYCLDKLNKNSSKYWHMSIILGGF